MLSPRTDFSPPVIFRRFDPACNMARVYVLSLERTLWGTFAVVRQYGRIRAFGRTRAEHFATRGEAEVHRMRLAALKLKRGYRPASSWPPDHIP